MTTLGVPSQDQFDTPADAAAARSASLFVRSAGLAHIQICIYIHI